MFGPEINSLMIVAELVRAGMGGSAAIQNRANEGLADQVSRNTITLSAPEYAAQTQGILVDCPWINPFPDGSRPLDGAEAPPHVTCEIFPDPNGGLPTLRAYVSNWPEDKAAMVAFAFQGSDTVIVTANPNNPNVNLQTICGIGPLNQWFLRGMSGWIWESGDFITEETASRACFDGVSQQTTITITDSSGTERQFLFDPTQSGHNGNQGAFQPFHRNEYDTNKIYFNPANPDTARTLSSMQNAIEEQLQIVSGDEVIVWPSMSYADGSSLLNYIPLPTPTPAPTEIPQPTSEYVAPIAAPAEIVTEMAKVAPELINNPNINIGLDLFTTNKNVKIFRENPIGTDPAELTTYLAMLNSTLDEQVLTDQFTNTTSSSTFGEWVKGVFGKYEPAVTLIDDQAISMTKILHINFSDPGSREIRIDGLDNLGKFVKIILPIKGGFDIQTDGTMLFDNGTSFKFNAIDSTGAPDEASETLVRLVEQINHYYNISAESDSLPEVVVVPTQAVPYLYSENRSRDQIIYDAQSLKEKYPTVNATLAYFDETGAQHLVPNFQLPPGTVGTVKQLLLFNGVPIYELQVPLMGDLVSGNVITPETRNMITSQIPAGVAITNSITIFIPADQVAAVKTKLSNTTVPTPTQIVTTTPTPTLAPPTPTPLPHDQRFPTGDEIHIMDPMLDVRTFPTPTP